MDERYLKISGLNRDVRVAVFENPKNQTGGSFVGRHQVCNLLSPQEDLTVPLNPAKAYFLRMRDGRLPTHQMPIWPGEDDVNVRWHGA